MEPFFQKVLTAIGNFCICSIFVGILAELIVRYPIQHRKYREGIDNLLVLLIAGIPIAMPTVLSVTMAIGSHRLSQQGAITKRMTAIEEMAGMDVLCSDKTGTLTLNKLTVDRNLIEVFAKGVDRDLVILLTTRASSTKNQDAIDAAIVGMLADPKEVHFLPFNPVDKRTTLTYIDASGNWHRASKGAPEQILALCNCKEDVRKKVHSVIEKFAERGLRSLAVARQEVPEKTKDSPGAPWQFVGLLPLFDPPRHDSADTIKRALNLGVNVKMITACNWQGNWLGMGTNMYPSSKLLGQDKDASVAALPVDELIEKADGFAGVFPAEKFGVRPLGETRPQQMMAALYLQVSIVSQALIFVTRSRSWSFAERPGLLLLFGFVAAQLIATLIAVYAKWSFAKIEGCGWGWAGVIWLYSTAFTTKTNYGKEEREAQWATAQRTLHGLQPLETTNLFSNKSNYRELSEIAEQAKRRAEVASPEPGSTRAS
ncbi:unnamed protein product [Camellia sinensis]